MKHHTWPRRAFRPRRGALRTVSRVATLAALLVGGLTLASGPASAAALTAVTWAVSDNTISGATQTGGTNVTYTWHFTTATQGTIDHITFTVPTGTTAPGALTVNVFGIDGTGATASLDGPSSTVTLQLGTPQLVDVGVPIDVAIGGFTNRTTVSAGETSTVTTLTAVPLRGRLPERRGPTASAPRLPAARQEPPKGAHRHHSGDAPDQPTWVIGSVPRTRFPAFLTALETAL